MSRALAIDGGKPVRSEEFPRWPRLRPSQIDAALGVLASGRLNSWTGCNTREFEQRYASLLGVGDALAVANGTVALEIALKAVGIMPGDEVVVTSRSFVASASSPALCGAVPVFADVDIESQNVTAESIGRVLTAKTRAIIVVHLYGWPCNMDAILALAEPLGILVIEDCAQAHGALWKGQPVGSFGKASIFSFCNDKIVTTAGEGGMIVTSSDLVWRKAWSLREHGKGFDKTFLWSHPTGYRLLHESLGTNARLTECQAAVGLDALHYLDEEVRCRRTNAACITRCLSDLSGIDGPSPPRRTSSSPIPSPACGSI